MNDAGQQQLKPAVLAVSPADKPGHKTSEFRLALGVILLAVVLAVLQALPWDWAISTAAIVSSIYSVLRVLLKLNGQGAAVDQADQLRDVVAEEIRFALAEHRKALPADPPTPKDGGYSTPAVLAAIIALFLVGTALLGLDRLLADSKPAFRVDQYAEAQGNYAPWLKTVPVEDPRPFLVRLADSIRFSFAVEPVATSTNAYTVRVTKVQIQGGAEF